MGRTQARRGHQRNAGAAHALSEPSKKPGRGLCPCMFLIQLSFCSVPALTRCRGEIPLRCRETHDQIIHIPSVRGVL